MEIHPMIRSVKTFKLKTNQIKATEQLSFGNVIYLCFTFLYISPASPMRKKLKGHMIGSECNALV